MAVFRIDCPDGCGGHACVIIYQDEADDGTLSAMAGTCSKCDTHFTLVLVRADDPGFDGIDSDDPLGQPSPPIRETIRIEEPEYGDTGFDDHEPTEGDPLWTAHQDQYVAGPPVEVYADVGDGAGPQLIRREPARKPDQESSSLKASLPITLSITIEVR